MLSRLRKYDVYIQQPERIQQYLQGRKASSYEYNYGKALESAGWDYIFQFDILGGRAFGGGFIIDFMVFTVPLWTPVWIHGEWWHSGKQKQIDAYQQAILKYVTQGQYAEPIIHFGVEVATIELARSAVRKDFG